MLWYEHFSSATGVEEGAGDFRWARLVLTDAIALSKVLSMLVGGGCTLGGGGRTLGGGGCMLVGGGRTLGGGGRTLGGGGCMLGGGGRMLGGGCCPLEGTHDPRVNSKLSRRGELSSGELQTSSSRSGERTHTSSEVLVTSCVTPPPSLAEGVSSSCRGENARTAVMAFCKGPVALW